MIEVMSDGQTLKTLILSKAARGKFISVHRTIRDLQSCDDYIAESEGKGNDMELIKSYIMGQATAKPVVKTDDTLSTISNTLVQLNNRMDKAGL